jgi:hypothetical protein
LERSGALQKRMKRKRHVLAVLAVDAMKKRKLHVLVAVLVVPGVRVMKSLKMSRRMTTLKMKRKKRNRALHAQPGVLRDPQGVVLGGEVSLKTNQRMKRRKSLQPVVQGAVRQLQRLHAADHQADQGKTRTTLLKPALPLAFE